MSRVERIGDAVLYLGRCEDIVPTLARPAALIGDPPYGMGWDTKSTRFSGGHRDSVARRGQGRADWGNVIADDQPFDPTPWLDFPHVVLWGANHFGQRLPVGTTLVWIKRFDHAFGSFLSDAEVAWVRGNHGVYCRRDTSLMGETWERVHPTQKPVSLMSWCIEQARVPAGGVILDPWMGSGSTGVAAVQRGHPFIGCEVEPLYFETAVRRITEATRYKDLFHAPAPAPPAATADLFAGVTP